MEGERSVDILRVVEPNRAGAGERERHTQSTTHKSNTTKRGRQQRDVTPSHPPHGRALTGERWRRRAGSFGLEFRISYHIIITLPVISSLAPAIASGLHYKHAGEMGTVK